MYRFEKLLVNLSLTESDVPLLKFAGLVSRLAHSKSVHFLYAREAVEVPESLKQQYPWLVEPIAKSAKERAESYVAKYFDGYESCAQSIELLDQLPTTAVLEHALENNTDLILTGDLDLDRALPTKLARKAPCSVLLIPAEHSGGLSRIGMALDLSQYSKYAVDVATAFAAAHKTETVDCINYFTIPAGFHKTPLPRDEYLRELRSFSQKKLEDFIAEQDLKGVSVNAIAKESPIPADSIIHDAETHNYDLIVVGCRGKDAMTASLLGSNAEDVLRGSKHAAVLAVKEKGTGRSFLESLLRLASGSPA